MKLLMISTFILFTSLVHAEEMSQLEKACENSDGLACAKTAYHFRRQGDALKAYKFYQKGCELKDETACYNMNSLGPRDIYTKKMSAVMNFNMTNISNCHVPVITARSTTQLKEKWHKATFIMHINKHGVADAINVVSELSPEFKKCARNLVSRLQFPKPEGIDPSFEYELTIRSFE